ncbi:MAG TPA: DUF1501 domain-containing protein [Cyclobacteriaceae bacterium]|nr:DUF1501 domain-containing protein [Cyclobacteriaceae bacterium]
MRRRNFLKKLPVAISIPFTIGGIPIKLMAENPLSRLAQQSTNDRVLIILQLHGGNDGLNSLIPVEDYDLYYSKRANIAIPEKKYIPLDSTLPLASQVGLHPAMQPMKALYDQGRVAFVQGVSYKNNNGSHFRGRDIWFMGGGADDYFGSGWVGRYLQQEFAPETYPDDFPNSTMPDPLAIEMGSDVSLIFHQDGNIPASISLDNPERFFDLVDTLEGFDDVEIDRRGIPPAALNPSPYWQELNWILQLEDKSEDYAERLYEVYQQGRESTVTYPETYPLNAPAGSKRNPLTPQLKLIARLMDGGCKTKVYMVKIGGFDTHAEQVESYDPTMGVHAALMYHISGAMKAFQEDLRAKGLEDRVLTVTTSEFGRRIYSNGSFGTDHGTGGPIFIFGKGVKPGVVGTVPDMTQGNIPMQFDYRQVYANLLKDWMLVDEAKINSDIFFKNFIDGPKEDGTGFYEPLPLANQVITGVDDFVNSRFILEDCYPNPAKDKTTIHFRTNNAGIVTVDLFDSMGKISKGLINENFDPGEHRVEVDLSNLPAGTYVYQMKTGFYKESKKLVIVK